MNFALYAEQQLAQWPQHRDKSILIHYGDPNQTVCKARTDQVWHPSKIVLETSTDSNIIFFSNLRWPKVIGNGVPKYREITVNAGKLVVH